MVPGIDLGSAMQRLPETVLLHGGGGGCGTVGA
jgi:hypothetical protein